MGTPIHESGHAVALFCAGVPVRRLYAFESSGGCLPASEPEPEDHAVVCLAGGIAERLLSADVKDCSAEDLAALELAYAEIGCCDGRRKRFYIERTERLIWEHVEQISYLASVLRVRQELYHGDLARLVHQPGSPLAEWRHLYEPLRPAYPSRPSLLSMNLSLRPGSPGWKPEWDAWHRKCVEAALSD